jgi:hypothetical protein
MRLPDWEKRLAEHFARSRARAFGWGEFDCALAVCEGIEAVTGVDPGKSYRGKYMSEKEALALIGGDLGTFVAGIAGELEFRELRPTFARRGDVVLVDNGDPTHALGTADLSGRFAWCASERGFIRVPMKYWLRAWKIE